MIRGELMAIISLFLLTAGLVPLALSVLDRTAQSAKQNGGNLTRANILEVAGLFLVACGVFGLTALTMLRGWFWTLEIPLQLAIGWVMYLERVLKDVRPDAASVASAVVCVTAVAVGLHVFMRWLTASGGRRWPWKRTVKLLLLVVLLFASGLAAVGLVQQTGWLIRTPEPLVKDNRLIS